MPSLSDTLFLPPDPKHTSIDIAFEKHIIQLQGVYIETQENPNWGFKICQATNAKTNPSFDIPQNFPAALESHGVSKKHRKTTNCKNHTQKPESKPSQESKPPILRRENIAQC
jgi:hypothetical protein